MTGAHMCIRRPGSRTGVSVDPGAVIGPRAEIGGGTIDRRQCA